MLDDIGVLTGGAVFSEDLGLKLENAEITDLGRARRVIASKDATTIVDGKGNAAEIKTRIEKLKSEIGLKD